MFPGERSAGLHAINVDQEGMGTFGSFYAAGCVAQ
jgi:hypothetical protein